jgi:HEPN domain-containing protein
MTEKIEAEVNEILEKVRKKNSAELKMALIKPLTKDYPFCSNGIYLFSGSMGAGKSYEIIRHILISEKLFDEPYYSLIVFCSTSGGLDKTVQSFLPKIKTPIAFMPDTSLMPFLRRHIKVKKKYYALVQFLNGNLKNPSSEMERIITKHGLKKKEQQLKYIAEKLLKYNTSRYPANLLLVLDDFASNPLLQQKESELNRLLTKTRHYNITCIIAVQTVKFIIKNLKRMLTDCVIWRGLSKDDWDGLFKELSHSFNQDELWKDYHSLQDQHSRLELHLIANKYKFQLEGEDVFKD